LITSIPCDINTLIVKKIKAVALFSGGLDSQLSVKIMLNLGIDVYAISFITPFSIPHQGCIKDIRASSQRLNISLKVQSLGNEYIELIKNPEFGYGKNMNPCIDCRILMLEKAKKYLDEINAKFIITGEVLGERPMTQNKNSMMLIERQSGLSGLILRPLSAKLLEPSLPEKNGWVESESLFAIQGRSRKPQMELAQRFGILEYPTPAGGCLLTDSIFSRKLRDAFEHKEYSVRQLTLLRYGRHFRLKSGAKVIVGRNEKENAIILALADSEDYCLETENFVGPITLLHGSSEKDDVKIAASICLRYSDCIEPEGKISYWRGKDNHNVVQVNKIEKQNLEELRT